MPGIVRLGPGGKLRFQVRHPKLGWGSSWALVTSTTTGDVYLSHRDSAWLKSSFHESGRWHYAVSADGLAREPESTPYLLVRREHPEVAPGWHHAAQILVARSELRHIPENVKTRGVVHVALPWGWDAVAVDVYIGSPGRPLRLGLRPPARVVADMQRGDGGRVAVIRTVASLPQTVGRAFGDQIRQARLDMLAQGWDGRPTRISLFGEDVERGAHWEVEVAVDGP